VKRNENRFLLLKTEGLTHSLRKDKKTKKRKEKGNGETGDSGPSKKPRIVDHAVTTGPVDEPALPIHT
jgi:hypothetical protein